MSCSYAEGLSPYLHKGKLGLAETSDTKEELDEKVKTLCSWIEKANHVVLHTGAGISTSAGIPDFRGPNGVWTLEKKGIKPEINISFDDAKPTLTHMAIPELIKHKKIHYVVSQNIDALHLKSGLNRKYLAELHGNMFVDQCSKCERQFVRKTATNSVGQKSLNIPCPYKGVRSCRGTLHDTVLDWEHNLPQKDINLGDYNSSIADLSICMGTTLQINPSGMLPIYTKKYNQGKLVICNLSQTKHDKKSDLIIRGYIDEILIRIMKYFNLTIPEYNKEKDPTKYQNESYEVEWTLNNTDVMNVKRKYEEKMKENKSKSKKIKIEKLTKSEEQIENDDKDKNMLKPEKINEKKIKNEDKDDEEEKVLKINKNEEVEEEENKEEDSDNKEIDLKKEEVIVNDKDEKNKINEKLKKEMKLELKKKENNDVDDCKNKLKEIIDIKTKEEKNKINEEIKLEEGEEEKEILQDNVVVI